MYNKTKKIVTVVVMSLILMALSNCAGFNFGSGYTDNVPSEMKELIKEKYAQSLYAIGTANGPNEGIAERKATLQARAEIGRQFKSQIDALQKSYEETVNDKSLEEYKQTTEIFASVEIAGSKVVKTMIKSKEHGFSAKVLVILSAKQLKIIVDQKMQALTSFKASKGYKDLEERVEAEKSSN